MKQIVSVLKNEIFNQYENAESLVKKVAVSQESYLKDRSNEACFNIWSENVKELQKAEFNLRALKSAYATIAVALEIEPMTVEEIVAEKQTRQDRKKERKPRVKKSVESPKAE